MKLWHLQSREKKNPGVEILKRCLRDILAWWLDGHDQGEHRNKANQVFYLDGRRFAYTDPVTSEPIVWVVLRAPRLLGGEAIKMGWFVHMTRAGQTFPLGNKWLIIGITKPITLQIVSESTWNLVLHTSTVSGKDVVQHREGTSRGRSTLPARAHMENTGQPQDAGAFLLASFLHSLLPAFLFLSSFPYDCFPV